MSQALRCGSKWHLRPTSQCQDYYQYRTATGYVITHCYHKQADSPSVHLPVQAAHGLLKQLVVPLDAVSGFTLLHQHEACLLKKTGQETPEIIDANELCAGKGV